MNLSFQPSQKYVSDCHSHGNSQSLLRRNAVIDTRLPSRNAGMSYRIQGRLPDTSTSAVSHALSKLQPWTERARPGCAFHRLNQHFPRTHLDPSQKLSHLVKPDKVKCKMLDHTQPTNRFLRHSQKASVPSPQPTPLSLSIPPTLSGLIAPNVYRI